MNNQEKKIFILAVVGSIMAVAFTFSAFFIPSIQTLKRASERSEERRLFMEKIDNYNNSLTNLKKGLIDNEEDIKKIKEKLLSGDEIIRVIVLLENLSDQVNVNQEISISRQAEDKVVLKNSINGKFNNIVQYVDGVENLAYVVEVEETTFLATKNDDVSKAEIILNVPIYYQSTINNEEDLK